MTRQPSEVITGQHAIYRTMDAALAEVKRKGLGVIRYVVARVSMLVFARNACQTMKGRWP